LHWLKLSRFDWSRSSSPSKNPISKKTWGDISFSNFLDSWNDFSWVRFVLMDKCISLKASSIGALAPIAVRNSKYFLKFQGENFFRLAIELYFMFLVISHEKALLIKESEYIDLETLSISVRVIEAKLQNNRFFGSFFFHQCFRHIRATNPLIHIQSKGKIKIRISLKTMKDSVFTFVR